MYIPDHFSWQDKEEIFLFIESYNFGQIVSYGPAGLNATHLPFLIEKQGEEITLYGHFARTNDHWQKINDQQAMAIFQGPHAYVSPVWYETSGVPTWNYLAVHVYGEIELVEKNEALHDIVLGLSDKHEKHRQEPWIPDYGNNMLNAIVGFKMTATEIQAKQKLSQNKSDNDRSGIIRGLIEGGSENEMIIANWMSK